jgi:hypothetical protein
MKLSCFQLCAFILVASLCLSSCKKDDNEGGNAINTYSLTVQNQLNGSPATALSLVNLTDGKVYNSTDAKANQGKVDFIYHQYTGTAQNKDSYFYSIEYIKNGTSGYEQDVRDALGIQTWTTVTNSTVTRVQNLTVGDFDAITNATELRAALDKVTNALTVNEAVTTIDGQPAGSIYSFLATNNKSGLIKLKAARTGTGGGIDIDVKVEK